MLSKIKNVPAVWLIFVALIPLEYFLFRTYVLRNIVNFYPTNFDQSSYLPYTYGIYENIRQYGFILGIKNSPSLATGLLFPIQSVIFYVMFGASRLTALLPNLVYFIILQVMAVYSVRSISKKNYLSLIFLGLILAMKTPFLNAGGLMDFRMDFLAFCLYGIILCSTVKSDFFYDRRWAVITGILAVFSFLLRLITFTYLLPVLGIVFCYTLFVLKRSRRQSPEFFRNKTRAIHLFFILATISIVGVVYVWMNETTLFNYYMVGHLLGEEKHIRATSLGITNIYQLLYFYPNSLLYSHVGLSATITAVITFLIFLLLSVIQKQPAENTPVANNIQWKTGIVLFLSSFFIPLVILTLDINKSAVVGSIMVMPCLWLVMWSYLYLDRLSKKTAFSTTLLNCLAAIIFCLGLYNQISELLHHKSNADVADLTAITNMYLDVGDYASAKNWNEIRLSDDQICGYITSGGMETVYYEMRGKLINIAIERMGGAIFAIKKDEIIPSLQRSNVVILNLNDYPPSAYPFDQSIKPFRPFIFAYVDKHFKRLGDYRFLKSTYRVYVARG